MDAGSASARSFGRSRAACGGARWCRRTTGLRHRLASLKRDRTTQGWAARQYNPPRQPSHLYRIREARRFLLNCPSVQNVPGRHAYTSIIGQLDADCFYVSAERIRDEFLLGKPVGCAGTRERARSPESHEMKAAGVATGMSIGERW